MFICQEMKVGVKRGQGKAADPDRYNVRVTKKSLLRIEYKYRPRVNNLHSIV